MLCFSIYGITVHGMDGRSRVQGITAIAEEGESWLIFYTHSPPLDPRPSPPFHFLLTP
jgi:hypothetical protein